MIRLPHKWKASPSAVIPPGPTTVVAVTEGSAGTIISVPHPRDPRRSFDVDVPTTVRTGQALLVQVPPLIGDIEAPLKPAASGSFIQPTGPAAFESAAAERKGPRQKDWTTAQKVIATIGGAAGVCALAGAAA